MGLKQRTVMIGTIIITTAMILLEAIPAQGQVCPYDVTIQGHITEPDGSPVEGVEMSGDGVFFDDVTDSSGFYIVVVSGGVEGL